MARFKKKKYKLIKATADFDSMNGKGDKSLKEDIPEYLARSSDLVITPNHDNNTMIVMGRDRYSLEKETYFDEKGRKKKRTKEQFTRDPTTTSLVSGYSDHQGAGAIDIVVGRGAPYPTSKPGAPMVPLFQTVRDSKGTGKGITLADGESKHPGIFMDAARIYISQMADIDKYFDIGHPVSHPIDRSPSSAIMSKADRIRLHARRDIKIVAGGDGAVNMDSNGYTIRERPKIHLIVGNGEFGYSRQQPIPLGYNLINCIERIYKCQQNILEVVNNLITSQMALNIVVANSIRVSPSGPTATDPVSQAMSVVKSFQDMNDLFNVYFSKFYNIPADELGYLNPSNRQYILSRNVTTN